MHNPTRIEYDDTQVIDMTRWEDATQPMATIPMEELIATPPQGVRIARSYSRDLEIRPDLDRTPTADMPRTIAPHSDGVPVRVWPERARRLTLPMGSRGCGPHLVLR